MKQLLFKSFQGSWWSYEITSGAIRPLKSSDIAALPEEADDKYFSGIRQLTVSDMSLHEEDLNPEKFVAEAFLTLSVTEACSNRCAYCIFGGRYPDERSHSNRVLSRDDAIRAVDDFCRDVGCVVRNFSFYGGEPMFGEGFDIIKDVVAHIRSRHHDSVNRFTLTTNGNHFTPEAVQFLIEHDFHIGVSLDGPRSIHDRNRRTCQGEPTFDRIMAGLALIREINPDFYQKNVRFICVLTPPLDYGEISEFFSGNELTKFNDVLVSNVSLTGQDYYSDDEVVEFSKQTIEMVRTAAEKLFQAVKNGSIATQAFEKGLFLKELMTLWSRDHQAHYEYLDLLGRCLPGKFKRFLATDGTYYICEKMQGCYPIGNVHRGVDLGRVFDMVKTHEKLIALKCPRCPYAKICTLCYVAACGDGHRFSASRLEENCIERRSFAKLLLRLYASLAELLGVDGFGRFLYGDKNNV